MENGGYMGILRVYHEIHCLVRIRNITPDIIC